MTTPVEISHDLGRPVEGIGGEPGEVVYETIELPFNALPELTTYKVGDNVTMRTNCKVIRVDEQEIKGKKTGFYTLQILEGEITSPNLADRAHEQMAGNVKKIEDVFESE